MKNTAVQSLVVKREYVSYKRKNEFYTNLCRTCNDCTNRPGESQSEERSDELINNESEDDSSSDDEYHGAMDNDELDISDYNQDDDLLELTDLLSDKEGDEDDIEEDVIDFSLT